MKTGLVLGKFYPLHNGHLFLIEEARKKCDMLIVVVGYLFTERIPFWVRAEWLKQLVPTNTFVITLSDNNPPNLDMESEEYYRIWGDNLKLNLPFVPTTIFGSELYVISLAKEMGIDWEIVDLDRKQVPISATRIRENPKKYLEYLPDIVKDYYVKGGE